MTHDHYGKHEHEHDCDHGHFCEHEHEDEDLHIVENGCEINISSHEQSYIASYKFSLPIVKDKAKNVFGLFVSNMCNQIEDIGGIIGHIKAIVRFSENGLRISSTESDFIDFKNIEGFESYVEGVAIVFAVDKEELANIVLKSYKKISECT